MQAESSGVCAMLVTIHEENRIRPAQKKFERRIEAATARTELMQLGFQGGGLDAKVFHLPRFGIWVGLGDTENRYWNALGIGNPFKDDRSIIVEVNPPKSGIDRRISGLFVEDNSGNIFMAHRGRVGGGRKGIGKIAFQKWYPEPLTTVYDCGRSASVTVIGNIDEEEFLDQLAAFTRRVAQFKREATI